MNEKNNFQRVLGELTDTIVEDYRTNLERCLSAISLEPCFDEGITEAELYFLDNNSHLGFFDPDKASAMAELYNFVQLRKASPEQIEKVTGKLLIPKIKSEEGSIPNLVIASRYFFAEINGIIMNRNYTTRIEPHDEIYLKLVQALYPSFRDLASLNAQTYNIIQERTREKCRSKSKLKQIVKIGTKFGYGIALE